MDDYKELLKKLTKKELKAIIKTYMAEHKILVSGLNKETLIKHIVNNTTMDKDFNIIPRDRFIRIPIEIKKKLKDKPKKEK